MNKSLVWTFRTWNLASNIHQHGHACFMCVHMSVCVCVREREKREKHNHYFFTTCFKMKLRDLWTAKDNRLVWISERCHSWEGKNHPSHCVSLLCFFITNS
jgi:hypothetical protein